LRRGRPTCERHVGDTGILPTSADIPVITGKPDLAELGGVFVCVAAFPDSRAERGTVFVEGKGLEGVLDSVCEIGVVESELLGGCSNAEPGEP